VKGVGDGLFDNADYKFKGCAPLYSLSLEGENIFFFGLGDGNHVSAPDSETVALIRGIHNILYP
jgi:hypothetical protein